MIPKYASVIAALAMSLSATSVEAAAVGCPRKETLGTSRELVVDPARTPRVGLKSFPQTLDLADKEVVLTFDDGPALPMTSSVLKALADQCVRATFFLVGRTAVQNAALIRRIAADGHTIAHHTWSHRDLAKIADGDAEDEINRGIAADETALHGVAATTPTTPFFRFPYFDSTPALLERLEKRGIAVFGADLWASDWEPMKPDEQLRLLIERLESARKGIILLHDPRAQTVAMLPPFLRYLRDHDYRIVHIVPAAPALAPTTAKLSPATKKD